MIQVERKWAIVFNDEIREVAGERGDLRDPKYGEEVIALPKNPPRLI